MKPVPANPRFLIDGYNLTFAIGYLYGRQKPEALHGAREKLLDFLKGHFKEDAHRLTVVFDAHHPPRGSNPDVWVRGIHVLYAIGHQVADDLLEIMLGMEKSPGSVVMVSNDSRLLEAACRKKAVPWTCDAFLDYLDARNQPGAPVDTRDAEAPKRLTAEETAHWMKEFGDLDNDPDMKKLGDLYRFDDDNARGIPKKKRKR